MLSLLQSILLWRNQVKQKQNLHPQKFPSIDFYVTVTVVHFYLNKLGKGETKTSLKISFHSRFMFWFKKQVKRNWTDLLLLVVVDNVLVSGAGLGEGVQLVHVVHVAPQFTQLLRNLKVGKVFSCQPNEKNNQTLLHVIPSD